MSVNFDTALYNSQPDGVALVESMTTLITGLANFMQPLIVASENVNNAEDINLTNLQNDMEKADPSKYGYYQTKIQVAMQGFQSDSSELKTLEQAIETANGIIPQNQTSVITNMNNITNLSSYSSSLIASN